MQWEQFVLRVKFPRQEEIREGLRIISWFPRTSSDANAASSCFVTEYARLAADTRSSRLLRLRKHLMAV